LLNKNVNFRIPQEEYYMYPTWLFLYNQVIILPTIWLSAMATKILMKKEMKRYLFGKKLYFKKKKNDFAPWSQVQNLATCNLAPFNFGNFQFWQFSILTTFSFDNFFGYFQAKLLKRLQEEQQQHIDCMDFVIKNSIYIIRVHEFQ
jgi:hypothetical protein